jgi:hypothetical protein
MDLVALKTAIVRALVVALIMLFAREAHAQLLSPGPLSKQHASLEGDTHCNDCHSSGKQVNQAGCLGCHGPIGARIGAGKGLHGTAFKGQPCANCHIEHRSGGGLVKWPSGDPSKLDHALTGWPLNGAHKTTGCRNCHKSASFLGLSSSCTPCHKDQHNGRFGNACTNCHDEQTWKNLNLKGFNHDQARFALRGAHQRVACAGCHQEPPKWIGLAFGQCIDCHKDPHKGRLGTTCTTCHEDTKWKPVSFSHSGARHPGVALIGGHATVLCGKCHDKGNLAAPSKGVECASCHQAVHKAPFGRACIGCHGSIQWMGLPRPVGLAAHTRTEYPLTGKHSDTNCAGCHKPELPRAARYRQLKFGRCADCHADKHQGEFAKRDNGECKSCHATAGFRPTLFSSAMHSDTKFPLVGKHGAAACSSCHTNARPRADLHVAKQACADCHANPHGDQFAKEMAQGGCAHCHSPTGWNLPKIDHSTWPLTGAHATAQCESCHHPTPEDKKSGKGASYRGVPRVCTGCHDDVHLGQFRLTQPVLECDKCHTTRAFKIPTFDHAANTNWALTGAHQKVECAKCHPVTKIKDSSEAARYRLPSHECKYCHANPHDSRGERAER